MPGAILLALMLAPTLEDSARALARRVAAALGPSEPVAAAFREVPAAARQAFRDELRRPAAPDPASVTVVLAEDRDGPLWVAEIVRNGKREAVVFERAKEAAEAPPGIVLERRLLWEQDAPILDATVSGPDVVVLSPDGISIYPGRGLPARAALPIVPPKPWPRDLRGRLTVEDNTFRVRLPGVTCNGVLGPEPKLDCRETNEPWTVPESAALDTPCGPVTLSTRASAVDEEDALQAFVMRDGEPAAAGPPLTFPGPVTALWTGRDSTLAVARDPETFRYAAYSITMACGR